MATSGTIATTSVPTNLLLDTAFRRCRVHPSKQTPELVTSTLQSLYMLMLGLVNEGLNLWCVQTYYVGCTANQGAYTAPEGTVDVLNAIYSQPTRATGTDVTDATSVTTTLSSDTKVVRIGIKFSSVPASGTLTLTGQAAITKTDWAANTWYWYNLDPAVTGTVFAASFSVAATFSEFYLASAIYDLPLTQWNRDTWSTINNKAQTGKPSTSYYYEKLITPRLTLWPIPNNSYDHLTLFTHRQIQDIGSLTQSIEIPQRWFEAICWQLAVRIAFECEFVDPALIPNISAMADKTFAEVETGESDGAPIYLAPNIGVYSR